MHGKAHLLRNIKQDEAHTMTGDSLDEKSVLLVQHWAMKFLRRRYRESQTDWFGKRGLSWNVTLAMYKSDNSEIHTMTSSMYSSLVDNKTAAQHCQS